ncbi:MAG: glycosyltransferase family 2 protein [Planctomycetota bacterium]
MSQTRLLIISPVRDEAAFLQRTIDSVVTQTVRPKTWIIVDDGSKDATAEIAEHAAQHHPWIQVLRRKDRGQRSVGGGVIEAFKDGLGRFNLDDFDYVCKLDGDLSFGPTYFEHLFKKFDADPRLGTASGKCWDKTGDGWVPLRTSDDFSLGACKTYRVLCFQEIGGLVQEAMWDGIDCHRCRMTGWNAKSYHDPELRLEEHRPMGTSHKSVYHGRFRWGRGQYFMGTHWVYVLAIGSYRMFERPWIIGGLCILAGYFVAAIRRANRYNDLEFRRHLRRWQLARLRPF